MRVEVAGTSAVVVKQGFESKRNFACSMPNPLNQLPRSIGDILGSSLSGYFSCTRTGSNPQPPHHGPLNSAPAFLYGDRIEGNERIIRGLLKLVPNRRCINCNSLKYSELQALEHILEHFMHSKKR